MFMREEQGYLMKNKGGGRNERKALGAKGPDLGLALEQIR